MLSAGNPAEWAKAGVYNVRSFGATGRGTADDTAPIQAAIDVAESAGGGIVSFPPGNYRITTLMLKEGVLLQGVNVLPYPGGSNVTRLSALKPGTMIDTPSSPIHGCGISGMFLQGGSLSFPSRGIHLRNVKRGVFDYLVLSGMSDEGLLGERDTGACYFEHIFAQNCLLTRPRATRSGVIDLAGHDNWIRDCEITSSSNSLSSPAMTVVALALRGANSMVSGFVGEIADVGVWIAPDAFWHKFTNSRADLNYGPGWLIEGQASLSTCDATRNSREASGMYSGFLLKGAKAQGNKLVACTSSSLNADLWKQKYGFEVVSTPVPANPNQFVACGGGGNVLGVFSS